MKFMFYINYCLELLKCSLGKIGVRNPYSELGDCP